MIKLILLAPFNELNLSQCIQASVFTESFSLLHTQKMKTLIFWVFLKISQSSSHDLSKRFLLFPRTDPTRHQFVAGIGIPLQLPHIAVTSGYVLRGVYYVPYNVQQIIPMFLKNETILADEIWDRLNRTDFVRRKREAIEENFQNISGEEEIQDWEESNNDQAYNSRWTFYDIIIGAIER